MNRLQLAQQGYRTLAAALAQDLDEQTSDRAEAWLRNEVCPVVEELAGHRGFCLAARWSLDRLGPGRDTPERRLVEAADEALVGCAAELARVTVPQSGTAVADPRLEDPPEVSPADQEAIALLASRAWFDLVCVEEFFHPWRDLHLREPGTLHTQAFRERHELRVPLGDYVSRGLLARIDYWRSLLDRLWNSVFHRLSGHDLCARQAQERLFSAKLKLDSAIEHLTAACRREPEARRREACATLTQVYAAYSAAPRLDWLPLSPDQARADQGLIRSCVRRRGKRVVLRPDTGGARRPVERESALLCDPDVLRQIAAALEDCARFYELPEDSDDLIQWARSRGRLVLVDRSPREVYWEGEPVAEGLWDTHPREWNLLWVLARSAGRPVDSMMLMNPERHSIKSRRHRLAKFLEQAPQLEALIETVRGQGYRLQLPAEDVLLLRDAGRDRLVFERAGLVDG